VVTAFNDTHVAQMLGYLNITGLQVALLLNFKEAKLDWKRAVNERRSKAANGANSPISPPSSASSASSAVRFPLRKPFKGKL
jgi:hypothetical protein